MSKRNFDQILQDLFDIQPTTITILNPITGEINEARTDIQYVAVRGNQFLTGDVYVALAGKPAGIYVFLLDKWTAKVYWDGLDYITTTATNIRTVFVNYKSYQVLDDYYNEDN